MIEAQTHAILAHLRSGGDLTPRDARNLCECDRLAARIFDLKQSGHAIESDWQKANGKRFKRYWLVRQ